MKPFLKNQYFLHFLSLHCAIRILICKDLLKEYIDYANDLLIYFVQEFGELYGNEFVNHNVHNLIHLILDVKTFGPLDKFSSFPFENYMHTIKIMIKTSTIVKPNVKCKPLSQFIKRVNEFDKYSSKYSSKIEGKNFIKRDGLRFINNKSAEDFSAVYYKNFSVKTKESNCSFILKNNQLIKIVDILRINNIFYIKYKNYKIRPYFDNRIESTVFWCGFVEITDIEHITSADNNIIRKALQNK
jgi:hypothetical protein